MPFNKVNDRVFVRDPYFVWLPAIVLEISEDNEKALVIIDLPREWKNTTFGAQLVQFEDLDQKHLWIDLNEYAHRQLPLRNEREARDMAELPHLHEAAILYQIKERHIQQKPYTRVGEIVVAVNPCQWIPDLYSPYRERMYGELCKFHDISGGENYREEKKEADIMVLRSNLVGHSYEVLNCEPHIYEVSAQAYQGLIVDKRNQTILVTGESGSGKTETVKLVLQHLASLQSNPDPCDTNNVNKELVQLILRSAPIFEAFGNAKTSRNDNSSRFGKATRLSYSGSNEPVVGLAGSSNVTFLLESSRIVAHSDGERNFHIFYQLLSASRDTKEQLLGEDWVDLKPEHFRYLCPFAEVSISGMNDADLWDRTRDALEYFGFEGDDLKVVAHALSIILRLGNMTFTEDDRQAKISSRSDLSSLAISLGISEDEVEMALTKQMMKVGKEELAVPYSAEQAREVSDALAKLLYNRIFGFVVNTINGKTAASDSPTNGMSVSVVDIFGFEKFDDNRFEQLCVNYASEKIQQKYVQDNLRRHIAEYELEGIDVFDFASIDNSETLRLYESPEGIISLLSEESILPTGNNEAFVFKLKDCNKGLKCLVNNNLHLKTQFGIVHFAGQVDYDASEFVERNTDKLPDSIVHLATRSSNNLVSNELKELFQLHERQSDSPNTKKKIMKITSIEKFHSQLLELIAAMNESHTRYVRCVKPCDSLVPDLFDHANVVRQLRSAGLVGAVELSRVTYPNKLKFDQIKGRFECLLTGPHRSNAREMVLHDEVQYMMWTIFAPVMEKYRESDFAMPFACGKSRVYFRAGALELLESMRLVCFVEKAELLQQWFRMVTNRKEYKVLRGSAITAQTMYRAHLAKRRYQLTKKAAAAIQAVVRMKLARRRFVTLKQAFLTLSKWIRSLVLAYRICKVNHSSRTLVLWTRKTLRKKKKLAASAASKIQLSFRLSRERRQQSDMAQSNAVVAAAMRLQAWYRGQMHARLFFRMKHAAALLSRWLRSQPLLRRGRTHEVDCFKAANVVQKYWRQYQLKKRHLCDGCQYSNVLTVTWNEPISIECHDQTSPERRSNSGVPLHAMRDEEIQSLEHELALYKQMVAELRNELHQTESEAEMYNQAVVEEFEDRLADYEKEVLDLKRQLRRSKEENHALRDEMSSTRAECMENVQLLKDGIHQTQASHKEYLSRIMEMIEKANETRKAETSSLQRELEKVKSGRDQQIKSLQAEVDSVRAENGTLKETIQEIETLKASQSERVDALDNEVATLKKENKRLKATCLDLKSRPATFSSDRGDSEIRRTIQKIEKLTSGKTLASIVKDSPIQDLTMDVYLERHVSAKCRRLTRRLEAFIISHESTTSGALAEEAQKLQQQLVKAYEEIEALQAELDQGGCCVHEP